MEPINLLDGRLPQSSTCKKTAVSAKVNKAKCNKIKYACI